MQNIRARLTAPWAAITRADLAWLGACVLLFWVGKWAGQLWRGVPGHAGAFWIPALILCRGTVSKPGAAAMASLLGSALWSLPRGDLDLAAYALAGLSLDLAVPRTERLRSLPVALTGGVLCHLAKFCVHNLPVALLAGPARFLTVGLAPTAGLHILFGLIGGLLGWLTLRAQWTRRK